MPAVAELNGLIACGITASLDLLRDEMSAESFPSNTELLRDRADQQTAGRGEPVASATR
jgi:hypothetical protein